MIKTTLWRPDTCECEIEYQWDSELSEDERVHTVSKIKKGCQYHSKLNEVDCFNTVSEENLRKNIVLKQIIENVESATQEKEQVDGSIVKDLANGKKYDWSFDKDRNLVVNLIGFTVQEKASTKTITDAIFDIGKVIIV